MNYDEIQQKVEEFLADIRGYVKQGDFTSAIIMAGSLRKALQDMRTELEQEMEQG